MKPLSEVSYTTIVQCLRADKYRARQMTVLMLRQVGAGILLGVLAAIVGATFLLR